MTQEELDYNQLEWWLDCKTYQLQTAQKLFKGGEVSAVMLDPVGNKFPRDWYPHLLKYEAGVGVVKGSINKAYLSPSGCDCEEHKAIMREVSDLYSPFEDSIEVHISIGNAQVFLL